MLISTSLMFLWALLVNIIQSIPALQSPLISQKNNAISDGLFADLEELSRIVDIAYCVGLTGLGIQKPFTCASRCQDFEGFELVTVCSACAAKPNIILTMVDMEHGSVLF